MWFPKTGEITRNFTGMVADTRNLPQTGSVLISSPNFYLRRGLQILLPTSIGITVVSALLPKLRYPVFDIAGKNTDLVYHLSAYLTDFTRSLDTYRLGLIDRRRPDQRLSELCTEILDVLYRDGGTRLRSSAISVPKNLSIRTQSS